MAAKKRTRGRTLVAYKEEKPPRRHRPSRFHVSEFVTLFALGLGWLRTVIELRGVSSGRGDRLILYLALPFAILGISILQLVWERASGEASFLGLLIFGYAIIACLFSCWGAAAPIFLAVDIIATVLVLGAIVFKAIFW